MATNKLKQIISTNGKQKPKHKRQLYIIKQINNKLEEGNAIITQADKSKSIVVINTDKYNKKVHTFIERNNFTPLTKDPTKNANN
jgi:hypothetical protein